MALKEYMDSAIYVLTMLVVFILYFIYSLYCNIDMVMAFIYSCFYGFIIGSGIYFGFRYWHIKIKKITR